MIQWMLANWPLVPLPFLHAAWTSGNSWFVYYWSLSWRILSITLLACEISANCVVVWTFIGIAFVWDWNENWPFLVLWPLLSFPNLLAYWVQHFHSIIFQYLAFGLGSRQDAMLAAPATMQAGVFLTPGHGQASEAIKEVLTWPQWSFQPPVPLTGLLCVEAAL